MQKRASSLNRISVPYLVAWWLTAPLVAGVLVPAPSAEDSDVVAEGPFEEDISVDGELVPAPSTEASALVRQAQQLKQDYASAPIPLDITLPVVASPQSAMQAGEGEEESGPLPIGFGRDVPAAYQGDLTPLLDWVTQSDGSLVSAFSVTSPGAKEVRIARSYLINV